MAHFRPLHDRILVKRIEAEEKTAGGIIIPDTAKEKPIEVLIDGEDRLIMKEADVFGVIEGDAHSSARAA